MEISTIRQDGAETSPEGPTDRRTAVLVLGMHRSGTSALARMLGLCGAALPKRLMAPNPSNPRGFWEADSVFRIHEELLAEAGSSWHDIALPSEAWFQSEAAARGRVRLVEALREDFGDARLVVIKDPRICRLLPLWRHVLAVFGAEPAVVIPVRDPLEVARSLEERDGFPPEKSVLLWLQHLLLAEQGSRNLPRSFVRYSDLLDDWRTVATTIERDLGLRLPLRGSEAGAAVDEFLARELRHHVVDPGRVFLQENAVRWVGAAYQWAVDASAGRHPDTERLDAILAEVRTADLAYGPLVAAADLAHRRDQAAAAARLDELNRELRLRGERSAAELSRVQTTVTVLQAELDRLRQTAAKSSAGRTTSVVSQAQEAEAVRAELARVEVERRALAQRTQALVARVGDLERRSPVGRFVRNKALALRGLAAAVRTPWPGESRLRRACKPMYWALTGQLSARLEEWCDLVRIRDSGLFDEANYLAWNPDIAAARMDPVLHYLRHGAAERRNPSVGFDTAYYLDQNPDVVQAGLNPLAHFVRWGALEERRVGRPDAAPIAVATAPVRLVAFYLPQFHPIPENDEWWGKGFTEWSCVSRAKPLYPGHRQPKYPADLGYYDLRVPEVREQQAELAREAGIHGFCYYYYWFNGRRLLNRPLDDVVTSGRPDFPFCICWANESWTRRWDGMEEDILMAQHHDHASDLRFIEEVIPILKDPRYIKVGGKPVLLVYRPELLQNPAETAAIWRDACQREGIPDVQLCAVQFRVGDPRPLGFDAAVQFPPHNFLAPVITSEFSGLSASFTGKIHDYEKGVIAATEQLPPDYVLYGGVMPAWDNTPRRGRAATIFFGSSPALYQTWLQRTLEQAPARSQGADALVFINAWNEWGEGACLEPDREHGHAYLDATKRAVEAVRQPAAVR